LACQEIVTIKPELSLIEKLSCLGVVASFFSFVSIPEVHATAHISFKDTLA
jgi:hypothetical protein